MVLRQVKVEASGSNDLDKMAAEAMKRLNEGGGGGGLGSVGMGGKKPSPALAAALRMAANKVGCYRGYTRYGVHFTNVGKI